MTIHASKIMNALINAGLTYSPEAGDPFPMKQVPCADVAKVVINFLAESGVEVEQDLNEWASISSFKYPNARLTR
jgi:hypothetical protein